MKKCMKCGHPLHKPDECLARVVDAAGDVDYCPCQVVGIKESRSYSEQMEAELEPRP